jgi:hypothetical protein
MTEEEVKDHVHWNEPSGVSDYRELAFPHHEVWDAEKTDIGWIGGGLTKRELFAAMAMQGLLADPNSDGESLRNLVTHSVVAADLLIEALSKEKK